jgi:hypothetical protein
MNRELRFSISSDNFHLVFVNLILHLGWSVVLDVGGYSRRRVMD